MDQSLQALCDALKKIINQLKPQHHAVSFLLLTGKTNQGKTTLLRQSHYEHMKVHVGRRADIYYTQDSIILELGEAWLNQGKNGLQYTLKQLNKCHRSLKINGIILCVDVKTLFIAEPLQLIELSKSHAQCLERFGLSLGYRVDTAIIFTKLDVLAGFCEFYQQEHATELSKPFGFSLSEINQQTTLTDTCKIQFDHFIEVLGQRVIHKIHPARSSLKRTLIREFPLQLACLRAPIQSLIQNISPKLFRLTALYFTSAEQGCVSVDRLNKKIQHEYGLTVQDQFPQSTNYQAYFIDGALRAFHAKTRRHAPHATAKSHKWILSSLAGVLGLSLVLIGRQHQQAIQILDDVSQELLTYDSLADHQKKQTSALYHLANASARLDNIPSSTLSLPIVQQLKHQLRVDAKQHLNSRFLPDLLSEIEKTITDNQQSQMARYDALKIYLMLAEPQRLSPSEVETWFRQHWETSSQNNLPKKLALLKNALRQPMQALAINQRIVTDARNYLNAFPATYLYYSLAKPAFSQEKRPLNIDGFALANKELPVYLTKEGFDQVMSILPDITAKLQADNWVLARQDLGQLEALLQQAYCYEYVAWWQNFMRHSGPLHSQDYQQALKVTQLLYKSNSIAKLVNLIQQETSPKSDHNSTLFNQAIASKFTDLSFISHSTVHNLTMTLNELERFLETLSVVSDQGKTAFTLTKARFQGDTLNNPLTTLYSYAQQLRDPVSAWAKQIADDTWFTLINDSKHYINQQWQQTVLDDYKHTIAQRFPFDTLATQDIAIADFDRFFATHGVLNNFIENYLKPFIDTSKPEWALKESNNYVLPVSTNVLNELIRANIVTNMFFANQGKTSQIEFSLQKLSLDPIVGSLRVSIGENSLVDSQSSSSMEHFSWPQPNAKLVIKSIEGKQYEVEESGPWAFFKILQKVNVLVDEEDPASLQILFEVNGNSGRYLLKTENEVNPFIPGILNGFNLPDLIV